MNEVEPFSVPDFTLTSLRNSGVSRRALRSIGLLGKGTFVVAVHLQDVPFAADSPGPSQRRLTITHDGLDDVEHGFQGLLVHAVEFLAGCVLNR